MEYMSKTVYNMIAKARKETCELNGWILITPKIAEELLKLNVNNYRVKNKDVVSKYAKDMLCGLWEANGEAIAFSKDGILRNGQHRLAAIVKSGKPVLMYMVFDANPSTIYDLQHKRTCVQILRAMGFGVSNVTPGVARTIIHGRIERLAIGEGKICEYVAKNFDYFKKTESIITERARFGKVGRKVSCAVVVYCALRTGEMTESELRMFFKVLNSGKKKGVNRNVTSILALRKQLMAIGDNNYDTRNHIMEYTYQAMKDFHAGTAIDNDFVYPENWNDVERLIKVVQCMDGMCAMAA